MGTSVSGLVGAGAVAWRPAKRPSPAWNSLEVVTGRDPLGHGIQLALATWSSVAPPGREVLRALHADRAGKRAISLIVAVWDEQRAWLFAPSSDNAPIELSHDQAQRIPQAGLDEPDGLAGPAGSLASPHPRAATRMRAAENLGRFR